MFPKKMGFAVGFPASFGASEFPTFREVSSAASRHSGIRCDVTADNILEGQGTYCGKSESFCQR
jgi:hypothetical protein